MYLCFRSSPAHVLALFARRGLAGELPRTAHGPIANAVIGSFVYVCRQLYGTCEGLLVLSTYALHTAIAEAWNQVRQPVGSLSLLPYNAE